MSSVNPLARDDSRKEQLHGSGICHSPATIAGGMPSRSPHLRPGDAPVGNLYGPLCRHLLPPGTRSACPDLCAWTAVGCGTQKRRIDRVSLRTRPPAPATLHGLGSLG